jgi:hypothetical protein
VESMGSLSTFRAVIGGDGSNRVGKMELRALDAMAVGLKAAQVNVAPALGDDATGFKQHREEGS